MQKMFVQLTKSKGMICDQVLLRKVGLPPVIANAIQEKTQERAGERADEIRPPEGTAGG